MLGSHVVTAQLSNARKQIDTGFGPRRACAASSAVSAEQKHMAGADVLVDEAKSTVPTGFQKVPDLRSRHQYGVCENNPTCCRFHLTLDVQTPSTRELHINFAVAVGVLHARIA